MSRRAILQIGTEKTGTTTLQRFLAQNRERLAARGYRYPRFCGERNHTGLAAYALDAAKTDPIREPFGYREPSDLAPMRARLERAARLELADGATAIFCSEHCHSRLQSPGEIARLRDFLAEFFDVVDVCIYLRRQDRVALSLYSTRIKSGGTGEPLLPAAAAASPYYNYDVSLGLWEAAFGRERMTVRLFDRAELTGGDIVSDFLAQWRLGAPADYIATPDCNGSIGAAAQEFLRHVNPHLEPLPGLAADAVRGPLVAQLEAWYPGRGAQPARAAARAFYATFRASNEAVRQRYFPDRISLFDDSFESYPETAEPRGVTPAAMGEIAGRLQIAARHEIRRLEAEVAIREARLAWAREDRSAAIAALRRAVGWCPGHAASWRVLGEYLLRESRLEEACAAARSATAHCPDSAEYWHFLGMVERRSGALDAALAAQERALALDPGCAGAARERGQLVALCAAATAPGQRHA